MKDPFLPGDFYHVFHHAVGKLSLFTDEGDYQTFFRKYHQFLGQHLTTYAYCLMPNHFHLLVRVAPNWDRARETKQKFSNFLNSYAQIYNRKHQTWGRVFQQGLPRTHLPDDASVVNVLHYIHRNPVNHGFISNAWHWRHSSLKALVSTTPTKLAREEVLGWFGGVDEFCRCTDAWDQPNPGHELPKGFMEP